MTNEFKFRALKVAASNHLVYKFSLLQFFLGALLSIKVKIIGEIHIAEMCSVIYIIVNYKYLIIKKPDRSLVIFAVLWASAQAVSDILNGTVLSDSIKGVFSPIIFISTYIFIKNHIEYRIQRLPSFLLGVAIGTFLMIIISQAEYFLYNHWKWGAGSAAISIFAIYVSFFKTKVSYLTIFAGVIFFAWVSMMNGARGLAAFPILAAIVSYLVRMGNGGIWTYFRGRFATVKITAIALPILFIFNGIFSAIFTSDEVLSQFSAEDAQKYVAQASGEYGVLLGGRAETLASIPAILDRPFLGHGSWAQDKTGEYTDKLLNGLYRLGYDEGIDDTSTDGRLSLIPAHSYIFGALVWAGIFGGIFWIRMIDVAIKNYVQKINVLPYYFHLGMIGFIWNVFFSPFGAASRFETAVFFAAFFAYSGKLGCAAK